jgi:hypothetical protein
MRIGRLRKTEEGGGRHPGECSTGPKPLEPSRMDIVAIVIAMFQLFLPLIVGLILVGVIVALILH